MAARRISAARQAWGEQFARHSTARKDLPGRCRLLTAPQAGADQHSGDQQLATLEYAAQIVAATAKRNPDRSIGVLVRRNKAVARMIHGSYG